MKLNEVIEYNLKKFKELGLDNPLQEIRYIILEPSREYKIKLHHCSQVVLPTRTESVSYEDTNHRTQRSAKG